jgi:hypothetical protein
MATLARNPRRSTGLLANLNGRHHKQALILFTLAVTVHYFEHIGQAVEVLGLGWKSKDAGGFIGLLYPPAVTSEIMHYSFAVFMTIGFWVLRPAFKGRALRWWTLAFVIEFWHHFEQFLLITQHYAHHYLFGGTEPTSVLQIFFPRLELHLFYNTIVAIPMVVALVFHFRPDASERARAVCNCVVPEPEPRAIVGPVSTEALATDADLAATDAPVSTTSGATETGATVD